MRSAMAFCLVSVLAVTAICQTSDRKWTTGVITQVTQHVDAAAPGTPTGKYDVSVRVGDVVYVVLYTPTPGNKLVEYRVGTDLNVLVGKKALKFNLIGGETKEAPILRKTAVARSSGKSAKPAE